MKVFVDANVIINVLNREYPAFEFSSRLLSLADDKRFTLYTSTLSLGICWYHAEKKSGRALANKKIRQLLQHIRITDCGESEVLKAIEDKKAEDFEDALQVYSAIKSGCSHIVTNNLNDFHFCVLPISNPRDFLIEQAS
ncbi:MAG TPA: PIN domain-containing protein [Flavobacteriales bacterium]|nr:PIN domain-containing protein [Flavobacteriales bacterium]HPH81043.1 PIN domain-containing protein [Flavobacteriales bacterium]